MYRDVVGIRADPHGLEADEHGAEENNQTSTPFALSLATCSATEFMKSLEIEVWFLMTEDD